LMYTANSLTTVTEAALTNRAPRLRIRPAYWDSSTLCSTCVYGANSEMVNSGMGTSRMV